MDHANVRVLITGSQYPVAVPERVQKHASDYSEVTVENGCMINYRELPIEQLLFRIPIIAGRAGGARHGEQGRSLFPARLPVNRGG